MVSVRETSLGNSSCWGKENECRWKGFSYIWRVIGKKENKPIVFLHGFGASSLHWRFNANFFANAGYCVYGIDLIGFGKSEQPHPKKLKKINNLIWAKQVSSFLKEIVLNKKHKQAILIGNSLGGLTALTTKVLNPEIVSAVIASPLPDPAIMQPYNTPSFLIKIKNYSINVIFYLIPLEIIIPLIYKTNIINLTLQSAYYNSIKNDKELKRIVIEPSQRRTAARALRAMCIGMLTRPRSITAPKLLQSLSKQTPRPPLLLVWGREDKLVPLLIAKKLIKQQNWIKLLILDKTGHCPHDENPNHFNNSVLKWLELNLNSNSQKA